MKKEKYDKETWNRKAVAACYFYHVPEAHPGEPYPEDFNALDILQEATLHSRWTCRRALRRAYRAKLTRGGYGLRDAAYAYPTNAGRKLIGVPINPHGV